MNRIRFPALAFPNLTVPARAATARITEWLLFGLSCVVLAMIVWGQLRVTGPVILALGTILAATQKLLERHSAICRLGILLLTIALAYLLRNYAPSLVAHRAGRFTLVCGVVLTLLHSLPRELIHQWRAIEEVLRKKPGSGLAGRIAVFGITLPAAYLYSTTTIHVWTGDTMPLVPTVVRMATAGERELSVFVPPSGFRRWDACGPQRPYFVREVPGRAGVYSTYPAGMEVFVWPTVLTLHLCGINLMDDELHLHIEKWTASILTGCSLALFFLIALHLGSPSAAFTVTWLMATGSVFSSTLGMLVWQQGGIVFWMLLALAVEFRTAGRPGWKGLILQSLACGWIIACRPSAVTFLIPFGLWVLARDRVRGILLPLLALICYLPWGLMYWSIYRNPFGPAMGFLGEHWKPAEFMLGVLFSPGRGLFIFQPFLVLAIASLIPTRSNNINAVGHNTPTGWQAFALGSIMLHLILIASWPVWWGGFCYGSRLIAEVVPLLALFTIRPVDQLLKSRTGWIPLAMIGVLGLAIHAPCMYYDAWLWNADPISADAHPERMWDWAHPPFLYGLVPKF